MTTLDVRTDSILSVILLVEDKHQQLGSAEERLVTSNLAKTLKSFSRDIYTIKSVRILNPRNFHFQPIGKERLLEVLSKTKQYSDNDIEYLANHYWFKHLIENEADPNPNIQDGTSEDVELLNGCVEILSSNEAIKNDNNSH